MAEKIGEKVGAKFGSIKVINDPLETVEMADDIIKVQNAASK